MAKAAATTTLPKNEILEVLDEMPDPIDVEELMYRLYLHEKWAAGEAAMAEGRVLTTDEVRARIAACRR